MNPNTRAKEEWKTVPSWPFLEASTRGRLRNVRTGNILKGVVDPFGSTLVHVRHLFNDGRRVQFSRRLNRLICEAFHGNPPDRSYYALALDGDSLNSAPDNLFWGSRRQRYRLMRQRMGHRQGRGEKTGVIKRGQFAPRHTRLTGIDEHLIRLMSARGIADRVILEAFKITPALLAELRHADQP